MKWIKELVSAILLFIVALWCLVAGLNAAEKLAAQHTMVHAVPFVGDYALLHDTTSPKK
jgi:hypothetical protein